MLQGGFSMKSQVVSLELDAKIAEQLKAMSRAGVAFYNAACRQRQEIDIPLNRIVQMKRLITLCEEAGIFSEALPYSVFHSLLTALDAAEYGERGLVPRSAKRFWPLTWSGEDIKFWDDKLVLKPGLQILLSKLKLPASGIICSVTIYKEWLGTNADIFSIRLRWKPVPPRCGPGKAISRTFGYSIRFRPNLTTAILSSLPSALQGKLEGGSR